VTAYGAAIATVLLWGSHFPLTSIALRSLEPIGLASFRIALAGALMGLWLAWKRPSVPAPKELAALGLSGLFGVTLFSLSLHTGQQTVTASATSFIVNTAPLLTALLAALVFGERLRAPAWLCSFLSFTGVAAIAAGQPGGLALGAGASLVLCAALCQSIGFVVQRDALRMHGPGTCVAIVVITGALLLSPWLPMAVLQVAAAPPTAIAAAVALGVLPAAIGNATWSHAQFHFGPSRAANFLYLVPAVASALAYLLTGEQPSWLTVAGGGLAIGGVVLFNLVQRRRPSDASH